MITALQLAFGMVAFASVSCVAALSVLSDPLSERAVLLSAFLATFNGVSALLLSQVGAQQTSTRGFFQAVLGGMVLRVGATLAGLVIGIKVLVLPPQPLAVALLAYTLVFIAAEVALWSRQNFSPQVQSS